MCGSRSATSTTSRMPAMMLPMEPTTEPSEAPPTVAIATAVRLSTRVDRRTPARTRASWMRTSVSASEPRNPSESSVRRRDTPTWKAETSPAVSTPEIRRRRATTATVPQIMRPAPHGRSRYSEGGLPLRNFELRPTLTLLEELRNDVARVTPVGFRLEVQDEAMRQDGRRDASDVLDGRNRGPSRGGL